MNSERMSQIHQGMRSLLFRGVFFTCAEAELALRTGDDHRAQGLGCDRGDVTRMGDAEGDEPGIGRHDDMHLLARAARLDGGSRHRLDERKIRLIRDEHGRSAVVEAPLAQLAHRHVGNVHALDRSDDLGVLDAGEPEHLPCAGLAVRLVDELVA